MNQQKFLFTLDGNKVSAKAGFGFYTKIDLGIAKYHFELGAGADHFEWRNLLELHSKTKIRRIRLPVLKMTVYHSDPAELYVHLLIIPKIPLSMFTHPSIPSLAESRTTS